MASGKGHYDTAEDYASRRYWFVFVAAGRRIRTTSPARRANSSSSLRFGNRPALPYVQPLTGQKGPIRKAPFVGELAVLLTERSLI